MSNWDTIRKSCESTPFVCVSTPEGNVRLWWSLRSGNYGHQVHWFAYNVADDAGTFGKTNGCGYCKESSALEYAFKALGKYPRGMTLGAQGVPYNYQVGGNFYKIPKRDWLKIK